LEKVEEGANANDLEVLANRLIAKEKAQASFKMVPGYHWATCVNVNAGLVHGIPTDKVVFQKGDLVSVDLGIYYQGFHTDTSFTVGIKTDLEVENFLSTGKETLKQVIAVCQPGGRIYDISRAIETTVKTAGYSPIRALVGHGIGRALHEEPPVPCFVSQKRSESPILNEGLVLAVEIMYAQGKPDVVLANDGWTISLADGKMAALFEETVAITRHGHLVLTA
jgi:methionyl aminopeptidase